MRPGFSLSCPGRDFENAIRSGTDFTGSDGWTTSRFGTIAASETGAKSRTGSYGSFAYSAGFTACEAAVPMRIV